MNNILQIHLFYQQSCTPPFKFGIIPLIGSLKLSICALKLILVYFLL